MLPQLSVYLNKKTYNFCGLKPRCFSAAAQRFFTCKNLLFLAKNDLDMIPYNSVVNKYFINLDLMSIVLTLGVKIRN